MQPRFYFNLNAVLILALIFAFNANIASATDNDAQIKQLTKHIIKAKKAKESSSIVNEDRYIGPVNPHLRRDDRGGPDEFGYRWRDNEEQNVEYEWIDITQGDMEGTVVQIGDDTNHGPFDLEWEFPFYDREFDSFRICSNGWISFTNQSTFYWVNGENNGQGADFPWAGNYPENVIAPFMTDLYPNGNCCWWYTDADDRIAIVSWIDILSYGDRQLRYTFQTILYGNGRIKLQYQTDQEIDDGHQVIIGIQNDDRDIGLTVLRGAGVGVPADEYAIDISKALGWVTGTVTDLENDEPLEGATVTLSDNTEAQTDEDGVYWLEEVLADPYTATASAFGYNPITSEEFEVADQETTTVDFTLPHPEILLDIENFSVELPQHGVEEDEFHIINDGNGELQFSMRYSVPVERDDQGDVIFDLPGSEITGDDRLRGIATDGENYYATGSNNRDEPNFVYVINRQGELVRRFEQPVDQPSNNGMKGITTDGNHLYSADGQNIVQFTLEGEAVGTIRSPLNPSPFITWDPESDHFWVSGIRSDLIEIDREGNTVSSVDNDLRIYGLAWHPNDLDGYNLYVFHRLQDGCQEVVSKVNVETGETLHVLDLATGEEDRAIDCAITNGYNPLIWLMVALVEERVPDRIVGVELELNTTWVEVEPMGGTVEPESDLPISIRFDAGEWIPGTYELLLLIESNAADGDLEIPLTLNVTGEGLEMEFYDFAETEIRHNFVITSVTLRGEPAEWGDEIGVFTPEGLCVGGSIWFDQATMVPAYGDDPGTEEIDGFTEDDPPAFRVWDADIDRDFAAEFNHVAGERTFQVDGSTRGTLEVPGQIRELVYELPIGWSMISANVLLEEHDIEIIFADLVEREALEMFKDSQGRFYRPEFGFINIPGWAEAEGYQIKLRREDSFSLTGEAIDPTTPLELDEGWNMISYYPRWEMDAFVTFEPLGENLLIAKDGLGHFYIPAWGFSNMGNLSELNGYQVKLEEAAEFRYPQAGRFAAFMPENTGMETLIRNFRYQQEHSTFQSSIQSVDPTGHNMSMLVLMPGWLEGSEVAVLDETGQTCGAGVLSNEDRVGIAVWGDDPTTPEIEGPEEGSHLSITAWLEEAGLVELQYTILAGEPVYHTDGFAVIEVPPINSELPSEFCLAGAFPNPFNATARLRYTIAEAGTARLVVYDVNGCEIAELVNNHSRPGVHEVEVDASGWSSGVYIAALKTGTNVDMVKLICVK